MTDISGVAPQKTGITVTPEDQAARIAAGQTPTQKNALTPEDYAAAGGMGLGGEGFVQPSAPTPEPGVTFKGPNAQEAADYVADIRAKANWPKDQQLPPVYDVQADARARGYTWDQIHDRLAQFKDHAMSLGYTNDEMNKYFLGVPLKDPIPGQKLPPPPADANIQDKLASAWRDVANTVGAPHDPAIETFGLPGVGYKGTATDILGSVGWGLTDAVKTFGASVWNGAAATAELADGKNSMRTPWEIAKLGLEATNFWGMFAPEAIGAFKGAGPVAGELAGGLAGGPEAVFGKDRFMGNSSTSTSLGFPKGPTPEAQTVEGSFRDVTPGRTLTLPKPDAFLDGAVAMAEHMEGGVTNENVASAMRGLGENYAKTGEHPVDAAERIIKGGQGASDVPPIDKGGPRPIPTPEQNFAFDNAAADTVTPPGRETFAPEESGLTFADMMKDESGALNLPQMVDIDPEKLFQPDPEMAEGIFHDIKAIFAPNTLAPNTAEMIADKLARSAVGTERTVGNLVRFGRAVGELSSVQRYDMINDIETGNLAGNTSWGAHDSPIQAMGRQLRAELDHVYTQMENRGIAPAYVEDYLPHLWADANQYRTWQRSSPMAGGKSFTKARVFGSYAEGIEAGMVPATDNPISMAAVAIKSMNRYIAAHDTLAEMQAVGSAQALAPGARPVDGWMPINGKLGITDKGQLYVPADVGRLFNSFTDPGFMNSSLYGVARSLNNTMTSFQLGVSGFHAGFITLDTVNSAVALAVQQFSRLSIEGMTSGIKTLITSPLAPFQDFVTGRRVWAAALGIDKVSTGADIALADALMSGGMRFSMGAEYRGSAMGSFVDALRGTFNPNSGFATLPQEVMQMYRDAVPVTAWGRAIAPSQVRATYQLVMRTMDTLMAPLMDYYVPIMKAGVASRMMADAMRVNPNMGYTELRHMANRIAWSVDNRMGEMVYDNRFWNKNLRDIAHVSIRAVGWHIGTIDELGGGVSDAIGGARYAGRSMELGDARQFSHRTAYLIGMTTTALAVGAIESYLYGTWNEDNGIRDYFFPRTGGTDQYGNPERISNPNYVKSAEQMRTQPTGKVVGDWVAPLWPFLNHLATNRDWDNSAITDPNEGLITNAEDYGKYWAKQYLPFSLQQYMNETANPESKISPFAQIMGITPAPAAIDNPGRGEAAAQKEQRSSVTKMHRKRGT